MYRDQRICVVMPAYNEAKLVGAVLDRIPDYVDTVLVVNDGSTDETPNIARERGALVVTHNMNRGVGAAFHTGVDKALELGTDIMVTIDADGQFNPSDINKLVDPIIDETAEFVTASRFKDKKLVPKMPRTKYWGNIATSMPIILKKQLYSTDCNGVL